MILRFGVSKKIEQFEPTLIVCGYLLFYWITKTLFLSLIPPLFWIRSDPRLQEISDAFHVNRLLIAGIGSVAFSLFAFRGSRRFQNRMNWTEILSRKERGLALQNYIKAVLLSAAFILGLILAGTHRFFGNILANDQLGVEIIIGFGRILLLFGITLSDELIFRGILLKELRNRFPTGIAVIITSSTFVFSKWIQFPIGLSQGLTLFLVSILLCNYVVNHGFSLKPILFWTGVLTVIHPLLSLPIFGSELPGFMMVKYLAPEMYDLSPFQSEILRLLTGGAAGPLSSVLLQGFLIAWTVRSSNQFRTS